MAFSKPNHYLSKTLLLNTITLSVRASTYELWGRGYNQSKIIPNRNDGLNSPKNMYKNIYSSLIHNSPHLEITQMFIYRRMDTLIALCSYN